MANYMKEVAKLLGVEFDKRFKIKNLDYEHEIRSNGLFRLDTLKTDSNDNVLIRLLTGEYEIQKYILKPKEKRYLENVLKPFKDKVKFITKYRGINNYFICIELDYDTITLPFFKGNDMYKGMEEDKRYSLKELNLFEED